MSAVKKVRFTEAELRRIDAFNGRTPLTRYGVSEHDSDELIVLHTFM